MTESLLTCRECNRTEATVACGMCEDCIEADSDVTHAVLVWNVGEWDARRVFYEGDQKHCERHVVHLRASRHLIPLEYRSAMVEVRPITMVPVGTRKLASDVEGAGEPL